MADDPEISHWLNNLLKREGQEAVFSDDFEDVDDINEFDHFSPTEFSSVNDHFETPDNDDTLDEARRLLNRWAEQTESFQKPPSNSKNSRQASNERKTPKVVQYRKLEMPMIVAKKKNDIKVNDPTLKMNERLKKVQEMKEKRLAKQNERKISPTKVTKKNFQKIEVPDVDAEIRSIRQKMNENINMKKKEIELREKRMKEIEDNLFPSSENQNDPKRKQKDNLRINQNINRKNMNDRNQIIKADLRRNHIIETPNKSKYQLRHDSSNNCESFNQPKNQNISEKSNKPITKLNSNQSIRKSINKSRYSPKNDSHINAQQNENSIQTSENYEQEQRRINNGIEMKLKIFINNEEFRKKRFFFHHWSEKCHYQTQAFQKAAILANFRLLSKTFAFWKEAQKKIEQRKEIEILEKELRDRKRKETEVNFYFRKRKLRSYFSSWKTKYKASIELQIAQARKNKRLELIATKITNQNHSNTNNKNERNLNKNHIQSQNRNPASRNHLIRQNQHLNNHPNNSFNDFDGIVVNSNRLNSENNSQGSNYSRNSPYQAQNSSSTNSPSTNHSPPKKVKKIKFDPKIEEMEKRNEEKKKKRLERIQKQKEEEIEQKLKKEKEEADKIKQKRKEHLQQLENERKKREELKLQQI
ncbi:hypothetical protein TRFO_21162 [Tritrichomonas foetus]|uniref:Uncharacterized protein n=1 Tax=Tritrichomonas foetus TaxID=1144522 RepID=A0A1J4KFI7_9EUKA|nr:hypothetical protein TRFO_21162 [Tritrichomonas foetus]|eukprot:OHT09802.1 hypothetical protein TRFO_21162 [Tritrichomonas foetus]